MKMPSITDKFEPAGRCPSRGAKPVTLLLAVALMVIAPRLAVPQSGDRIDEFRKLLYQMESYAYGTSHAWLDDFQKSMINVYNDPELQLQAEALMIESMSKDIPVAAKQMIAAYLATIATAQSVPTLGQMLADQTLADIGLSVIQNIPDESADQILVESLETAEGKTRLGIINSLGFRQNPESIPALEAMLGDPDRQVRHAAIDALGNIPGGTSAGVLFGAFKETTSMDKWVIADVMLSGVLSFPSMDSDMALDICNSVYVSEAPLSVKHAALKGILKFDVRKGGDMLNEAITGDDPELQIMAIPLLRDLPEATDLEDYVRLLPEMEKAPAIALFTVLADRKVAAVKPYVRQAAREDDPDVQLAAIHAYCAIASAEDVGELTALASASRGRPRDAARDCLATLRGTDVDEEIVKGLADPDARIRQEYVRAIGSRDLISSTEELIGMLHDPDRRVRVEAYRVLGQLAGPEYLDGILQAALEAESSAERNEAERTITTMALKEADNDRRVEEIMNALPRAKNDASRVMLIQSLGNIGNSMALPLLMDYLTSTNQDLHIAAIKALTVWPDASPLNDLRTIVETSEDLKAHNLAMRGYVRMVQISDQMTEDQKAEELRHAYDLAMGIDEQRMVVSGLSDIVSKAALQMAMELLDDPDLRSEAEAAIAAIAGPLGGRQPEWVRSQLNNLISTTDNPEFRARLEEILKWMD